jgi:hypothetical protein
MKKLYMIIITLLLVFSVGACSPHDTDLENRVETLENKVEELENILIDLEVIEGLNGQKEYYLPKDDSEFSVFNNQILSASEFEILGEELDKTKAPSYVLDENGEYIPFSEVARLLVLKYFNDKATVYNTSVGGSIMIEMTTENITKEEYLSRLVLLVEELSHYDWYIIGGSELYITTVIDGSIYINIPIQTMRSTFITFTPEILIKGLYEINLHNIVYDEAQVQTLYDEFVASGLYTGYVLDYS